MSRMDEKLAELEHNRRQEEPEKLTPDDLEVIKPFMGTTCSINPGFGERGGHLSSDFSSIMAGGASIIF